MSLRTDILASLAPPPLTIEPVVGSAWASRCHVRRLDGPLMVEYLDGDPKERIARLVVCSACDERGTRIFQIQDIPQLIGAGSDPEPLMAVWAAARKVNAFLFEGSEKNVGQAGDSLTDSGSKSDSGLAAA